MASLKSSFKFKAAVAAGLLSTILVGCGGSDSATTSTPPGTQPSTPPGTQPGQQAIDQAEIQLRQAQSALATATDKRKAYRDIQTAANNLVMVLQTNNGDLAKIESANAVSSEAGSQLVDMDYTALLVAERAYEDEKQKNKNSTLTDQIEAIKTAIDNLNESLENAKGLDASKRVDFRMAIVDAQSNIDAAEQESKSIAKINKDVEAWHDGIGTDPLKSANKVEYNLDNEDDLIDRYPNEINIHKSTLKARSSSVESIEDWEGAKFTDGDYEAYVYSNERMFDDAYDLDEWDHDNNTGTAELLSIELDVLTTSANRKMIEIEQIKDDDDFNVDNEEIRTFGNGSSQSQLVEGTFNGVEGNFYCNVDNCAVEFDDGEFELGTYTGGTFTPSAANSTEWRFVPNNESDEIQSYASYGYWIEEDGDDFTISAFHGFRGVEQFEPDNLKKTSLKNATYIGGAAGAYVIFGNEELLNDAGKFEAKVTLNADFEDVEISGTISDFKTDSEFDLNDTKMNDAIRDAIKSDTWEVELQMAGFDGDGEIDVEETIWTIDDKEYASGGEWSGQFRQFVEEDEDYPGVVTGEFSSFATNARMVGGFGANLDD